MKAVTVLCALLVASVSGQTHLSAEELSSKQQRFVTDIIASMIEDVLQSIKDAGLDPYYLQSQTWSWALPVPSILSTSATVEDISLNGLSELIIHRLNFATLATRLTFDIEMPRLAGSAGKATAWASFVGHRVEGEGSGSVVVSGIRMGGDVRVNVGIISGISIRSLELNFSIGSIQSNLNLVIHGYDVSPLLNSILNEHVPRALEEYSADINKLIETFVYDIINTILADWL